MPDSFEDRLEWLKKETDVVKPHLLVIDLMWDFVKAENSNDYIAVRNAVNTLQRTLKQADYKGALVVTAHGRKATNPDDPADDICGSTGQRGSFSTIVMLARNRKEGVYTIFSEQTNRDEVYGELEQTLIIRNPDGTLCLGSRLSELIKEEKRTKEEESLYLLLEYVYKHPGCEMQEIMNAVAMSKKRVLALMKKDRSIQARGGGVKGDPLKYFVSGMGDTGAEAAAQTPGVEISAALAEASRLAERGGIGRPN